MAQHASSPTRLWRTAGPGSNATLRWQSVPTYLEQILAAHRQAAAAAGQDLGHLASQAERCPPPRQFAAALQAAKAEQGVAVIAELKRRSPSKGLLAQLPDPALVAKSYESAGAACLSVLTDGEFFGGSATDLEEARAAVRLPVLRKDFTVSPADIYEARVMRADAVLLIVAALSPRELIELLSLARRLSLDALVEVHDEEESERALAAGATLIGVNQRDLFTFEVDSGRAARVARRLPAHVVKVAESGIKSRADVARLVDAGFDAVLVGEALVTAPDPGAALSALLGGTSCS
jgi:indole-3-glycerol phosphate synthase